MRPWARTIMRPCRTGDDNHLIWQDPLTFKVTNEVESAMTVDATPLVMRQF